LFHYFSFVNEQTLSFDAITDAPAIVNLQELVNGGSVALKENCLFATEFAQFNRLWNPQPLPMRLTTQCTS
jgi:hypothetical protein